MSQPCLLTTACCGTTTEGIAKVVNAVLVGIRRVLNALWREECIRIGIVTDECWITSGGTEIVEVMRGMDRKAMTPGEESLPHHLETFDFVAMYNNIPVTCLKRVMNELLELVYTYEETKSGWKSLYVRYAYNKDDTTPVINYVHWSSNPPVDAREVNKSTTEFYVGRTKLCQWIGFVLEDGLVQFGGHIYSHREYS